LVDFIILGTVLILIETGTLKEVKILLYFKNK